MQSEFVCVFLLYVRSMLAQIEQAGLTLVDNLVQIMKFEDGAQLRLNSIVRP